MTKAELIVRLEGLEGAVSEPDRHRLADQIALAVAPSRHGWGWAYAALGDQLDNVGAALALVSEKLPREQSGILREAWSAVSKRHALHMRFWNPETDGDYAHAIARRVLIALLKALPEGEAK